MTSSNLALGRGFDPVEPSRTQDLETVPPEARVQHQPESSPLSGGQDKQPHCPCEIPTVAHSSQHHPCLESLWDQDPSRPAQFPFQSLDKILHSRVNGEST